MNMEENSAAYYFSRSEASDDLVIKSLEKELGRDPVFKSIWKEASNSWEGNTDKELRGLREEHFIAMTAYTFGGDLYSSLNDGVRSYGGDLNKYNACFKLKSFHYLLSVALDELRNSSIGRLMYRGTWNNISGSLVPGKPGTEMRFGIFASTSFNEVLAEKFGIKPLFVISTSYGVDLRKFSFRPSQEEVLIPPYEKFIIKGIIPLSGGNRYTLESTGYEGVMVGLGSDGSGSLIVYSITPWWVWFPTALGILVILGGGGSLTWYCRNKSSRIPPDQPQTLAPLSPT